MKTVRVQCGEVCFRDAEGNFRRETVPLYREIPESETVPDTGLTKTEVRAASRAAHELFAPLFRETNLFREYIEECTKVGVSP